MLGTLINVGTVAIGSLIGIGLGNQLPRKIVDIVFQALGLFTLFIGVFMGFKTGNPLILVLSLILGGVLGEVVSLEKHTESLASKFKSKKKDQAGSERFTQGLVTAFMIFCVGSLTILGCIEEGLTGKRDLLITKSIMDFFSSMALASAFGRGVLFSVVPLLIYQGALTLGAEQLEGVMSQNMQNEMVAVGGLMLMGLGLNILEIKKIRVINFLPALILAPLMVYFAELFDIYNF